MAGNIAKRPDGRWRARYRDERGKKRARHFERRLDAKRWLDEISATLRDGTWVEPRAGNVTFEQFYAEWAPRQLWLPSTRANADLAVGSVPFGDLPFKAIRRSHIESWAKEASEKWAPTTVKVRFVIVRSVFRAALADRVIGADPCLGVALPRRRKAEAAMQIPTVEEVGKLLRHADSNRVSTRKGFRAYVALCAFAGLRKGEAAAVQVGDIDFLRRTLSVSRQLQRDGSTYVARLPKYGSERVVFLPDELVTILSEHIATHLPNAASDAWLFTVGDEPMYDNDITWRWRATRDSAQLSNVRLHDLRHFYASGLIAAGCDAVTVQRALGHSTATTTLNTYSHLWPTAEDRTRAAASGLMKQALQVDEPASEQPKPPPRRRRAFVTLEERLANVPESDQPTRPQRRRSVRQPENRVSDVTREQSRPDDLSL